MVVLKPVDKAIADNDHIYTVVSYPSIHVTTTRVDRTP